MKRKQWLGILLAAGMLCGCSEESSELTVDNGVSISEQEDSTGDYLIGGVKDEAPENSETGDGLTAAAPLIAPVVGRSAVEVATDPTSPIYSMSETSFPEAYVGTGYWLARTDANGNLSQMVDVYHYPVIGDGAMVSVLTGQIQDNGLWGWGAGLSYVEKLNGLLVNGGDYALVAGDDIMYAVGEDDSITVISQLNGVEYPDFTCTFAEASQFGNVVSLKSICEKPEI